MDRWRERRRADAKITTLRTPAGSGTLVLATCTAIGPARPSKRREGRRRLRNARQVATARIQTCFRRRRPRLFETEYGHCFRHDAVVASLVTSAARHFTTFSWLSRRRSRDGPACADWPARRQLRTDRGGYGQWRERCRERPLGRAHETSAPQYSGVRQRWPRGHSHTPTGHGLAGSCPTGPGRRVDRLARDPVTRR
jgi:hypothetical protein